VERHRAAALIILCTQPGRTGRRVCSSLAAVVLLLLGDVPEVSAALAGAAIARAFDVSEASAREKLRQQDEEEREEEPGRKDLDETRRLAYIALLSPGYSDRGLVSTVVTPLRTMG
jgi:hypothetical protein